MSKKLIADFKTVLFSVFLPESEAIVIGELDAPTGLVDAVVDVGAGPSCSGSQQYTPVPNDCSSFYQCVNNLKVKQSCSSGLHFNSVKNLCDWPASAGCSALNFRVAPTSCQEGSYLPDPADCEAYLFCVHSQYVQFRCQAGTHWDNNLKTCNHPEQAGCTASSSGQSTASTTTTDSTTTTSWESGSSGDTNSDGGQDNNDYNSGQWEDKCEIYGEYDCKGNKVTTQRVPIASVPLQGPLSGDYKVVCYFTNWAWYRQGAGKYRPEDIDPTICTHIVYGFAVLDYSTLLLKPHDSWADIDNDFYGKVVEYKRYGIKVTLAIGGWNDSEGDKYSRLVNNPAARKRFIEHAVKFIEKYDFDGLDLDWEYPSCWQVQQAIFSFNKNEVKRHFPKREIITIFLWGGGTRQCGSRNSSGPF